MEHLVDRMPTLLNRSELPTHLQKVNPEYVTGGVKQICDNIVAFGDGVVLLYGIRKGKSTNAAAILLTYLNSYRHVVTTDDVGLYVNVAELCYLNRALDKHTYSEELYEKYLRIKTAKCVVLDGVFSYLTQNDDLLLQTIYNARQYCKGLTVITTSTSDVLNCAGSILYRVSRDAKYKEEF